MSPLRANQALVADEVLLDGRLALFHQRERWLAVADLHFGYELSQRAAGWLVPMWGMTSIAERLLELISDAGELLRNIRELCEVIVVAGNHDRKLQGKIEMVESWETDQFHFHHGHCLIQPRDRIQIIGHHHPAQTITDGAGLRLKCPAFVQQASCWIMPAFSPWASGTEWTGEEQSRIWLCTAGRVFPLLEKEAA
jgi:uncharacterized protein